MGHAQIYKGRMKGDDPEIDTAQTPKRLDGRLALLGKIQKTSTDSIPNSVKKKSVCRIRRLATKTSLAKVKFIFKDNLQNTPTITNNYYRLMTMSLLFPCAL